MSALFFSSLSLCACGGSLAIHLKLIAVFLLIFCLYCSRGPNCAERLRLLQGAVEIHRRRRIEAVHTGKVA
jgi:hypothetical protein